MTLKKRLAYLAVGTLAVAGMTGTFGTAAFAAGDAELPTSGAAFDSLAQSLLSADGGADIQAVASDGAGNVVVYTTADADSLGEESRLLLGSAGNTVYKTISAPFEAYADDEVVGGAGYAAYQSPEDAEVGLCSVGFSGFTPAGDPAIISAGHCTDGSTKTLNALTVPSQDPAGGGDSPAFLAELGELGFSQFGGPGDSAGAAGDETSVDISAWDVTNDDLTLLPAVTDWTTAASEDLAASTLPVRSVGDASVGATVSKSGRTTGFSTGTVDSIKGWANVSGHQVYGFGAFLESKPGDSGGSMIQGDAAIGVVSGGTDIDGQSFVWGADLKAGLALAGGYSVAVKIDAPKVTFPGDGGDIYAGGIITGTGPAGTTLAVDPTEGESFTTDIDSSGNWSFPAPATPGEISYSIAATQGYSTSPLTTFSVDVLPAPLAAPVFTSPFEGQSVETSISAIRGTGTPGATVTLTGDVEDTATVASDGTWSVDVELGYGKYTVSAKQSSEGSTTSPAASLSFQVAPVAPAITDPKNGTGYDQGAGPKSVSGTGIDGATVTLWVNGAIVGTDTVSDGTWSIALGAELAAGKVTITATQTIEGAASAGTTSTITITAVNGGGGGNGGGSVPAGNPGTGLANTGGTVAPLLGGGLALLLAAGGALLIARRTNTARRSN